MKELDRRYDPECFWNFGGRDDEDGLRLDVECEEAYDNWIVIVKELNCCYVS